MADQPQDDRIRIDDRTGFEVLPLEARRRLWEQIWNRLLAPPIEPGDPTTADDCATNLTEEAASDAAA
jgi:hypothetical protein